MPAYLIGDINVFNPEKFEEYKRVAAATSVEYGAKYLVRGGKVESLEGDWTPSRFVVIEFPSMEKAKAWWNCQAYAGPKAIRQASAKSNFIIVEGYSG